MICGVDPGMGGGYGILSEDGQLISSGRYEAWGRVLLYLADIKLAAVELVGVWNTDSKAQSFSRSKLIENAAWWKGIFEGHGIKVISIHSRTWKQHFSLNLSPGVVKAIGRAKADKLKADMSLDLARRLWPKAMLKYQKDDGVADSLLIAEFARVKGVKCVKP